MRLRELALFELELGELGRRRALVKARIAPLLFELFLASFRRLELGEHLIALDGELLFAVLPAFLLFPRERARWPYASAPAAFCCFSRSTTVSASR